MKEETDLCEKHKDRQWVKQQSAYHLLVEKLLKEHLLLFIIHRRCSCLAEFIIYVNVVVVVHLFSESYSLLRLNNQRRKKNNWVVIVRQKSPVSIFWIRTCECLFVTSHIIIAFVECVLLMRKSFSGEKVQFGKKWHFKIVWFLVLVAKENDVMFPIKKFSSKKSFFCETPTFDWLTFDWFIRECFSRKKYRKTTWFP